MRVDPKGFYLCWVDQNNELDILDIATIRDVRNGQYAKKPRVSLKSHTISVNRSIKTVEKLASVKSFIFLSSHLTTFYLIRFAQFLHLVNVGACFSFSLAWFG